MTELKNKGIPLFPMAEKDRIYQYYSLTFLICLITFPADWSTIAAICPVYLYLNRGDFKKQSVTMFIWTFFYAVVYFIFMDKVYGILQMFTLLSLPILKQYNGERGKWKGRKRLWVQKMYLFR